MVNHPPLPAGLRTPPRGSRASRNCWPAPAPGSYGWARTTHRAVGRGAVLVDIRPAAQRAEHGEIPGAIVIERNVLEWRLDPRSDARLSFTRYDLEVIVTCQEGYTSSLAAAALQDLGLLRATDLDGGFKAWQAAGLPVDSEPAPRGGEGMTVVPLSAQRGLPKIVTTSGKL